MSSRAEGIDHAASKFIADRRTGNRIFPDFTQIASTLCAEGMFAANDKPSNQAGQMLDDESFLVIDGTRIDNGEVIFFIAYCFDKFGCSSDPGIELQSWPLARDLGQVAGQEYRGGVGLTARAMQPTLPSWKVAI
jgi:hypothetical protein